MVGAPLPLRSSGCTPMEHSTLACWRHIARTTGAFPALMPMHKKCPTPRALAAARVASRQESYFFGSSRSRWQYESTSIGKDGYCYMVEVGRLELSAPVR